MTKKYDCIVLGVGGFGSGVLDHLARRGVRTLGIEQFDVAHDRGSSHGETRITRKAYFEHPDYVPLLLRAFDLWAELEADHNRPLCNLCGLMLAGPADGEVVPGTKSAARLHGLPLEDLTATSAERRFPGFRVPAEFDVVFEADAGLLYVEECLRAHVARAERHGATLLTGETVRNWQSVGDTVRVQTDRCEYVAARLVITAGPWTRTVLRERSLPLEVVRKPLFWSNVTQPHYNIAAGCPAFLFELPEGIFYGFPCIDGRAIKIAEHTGGGPVSDPSLLNRDVDRSEIDPVEHFLRECLPGVSPTVCRHRLCMYTLTPDRHFIVDVHPDYANVVIAAGFSGHGFKFTSVLGEAMADLTLNGRTDLPIEFLSLNRFGKSPA